MGLSDIITTPFLLCLGICFLLIGLLGYYFIQKINEQNHKMNSMLDLITTIANELNNVNARLHSVPVGAVQNYQTTDLNQSPNNMLIPVSDDENDDINIGSEDESYDDEEEDDEEEDDNAKSFIKSINIGNVLNFNFDDAKLNEDIAEDEDEDEDEDENYNNNDSDSVSISSEKEGDLDSEEENEDEERDKEKSFEENPIQITNLEEIKESLKIDYKKFALNKLRSMVIDKGFTSDASKLKKQDLIKLLEEN